MRRGWQRNSANFAFASSEASPSTVIERASTNSQHGCLGNARFLSACASDDLHSRPKGARRVGHQDLRLTPHASLISLCNLVLLSTPDQERTIRRRESAPLGWLWPERNCTALLDVGLSIGPHGGVLSYSGEGVRGCGQTGLRCLRFRVFPIGGCV